MKHAPRTDLRRRAANAPQLVESQWGLLFDRNGFSFRDKPDRIARPERGDFVEQGFTDAADVGDAVMLQGLNDLVRSVIPIQGVETEAAQSLTRSGFKLPDQASASPSKR